MHDPLPSLDGLDRSFRAASDEMQVHLGRKDQLERRAAQVSTAVSLSKARLAVKAQADAFLEGMQVEAHRSVVEDYGRMLTAIVRDVLPHAAPIALRLYTERGMSKLSVVSQEGGDDQDLLDDVGLSVSNVVSLGLRAIAVVRSGMRPFLALDEPDIWIKQFRAPHFYRVVRQMAERMGIQVFVISHNDIAQFSQGISVVELSGRKDSANGILASVIQKGGDWPDGQVTGIRSVSLRNFATFVDVDIPLFPGVTALVGDNDVGKSRVMRALRSACYGGTNAADSTIRRGTPSCQVDLSLEGGRTMTWTRARKRNPKMTWRMVEADGSVRVVNGEECSGPGRDQGKMPPAWVDKEVGISMVGDLDIQLGRQRDPVFLLNQPGSVQAEVLSVGRESSMLMGMMSAHKLNSSRDTEVVRSGERELSTSMEQMAVLEGLSGVSHLLGEVEATLSRLHQDGAAADAAGLAVTRLAGLAQASSQASREVCLARQMQDFPGLDMRMDEARKVMLAGMEISKIRRELDQVVGELEIVRAMPELPGYPSVSDPVDEAASRIQGIRSRMVQAHREAVIAAGVLAVPPAMPGCDLADQSASSMERLRGDMEATAGDLAQARATQAGIRERIAAIVLDAGGMCPTCGTPGIGHHHVLERMT